MSGKPDDPIFDLIEAHRAADDAHQTSLEQGWGWDTAAPSIASNNALETLLEGVASTIPGLLAKLAYLRAIGEGEDAWMLSESEDDRVVLPLIRSIQSSIMRATS
jgi:hypothetical protein